VLTQIQLYTVSDGRHNQAKLEGWTQASHFESQRRIDISPFGSGGQPAAVKNYVNN